MPKKLDLYIIKTFLGPFFMVFSVLFFILMVNVVWIQMFHLGGKGLTAWELTKFFFYLSVEVIRTALPLAILLASMITFGGFGERYELAAMKSAGLSLWRIMRPLLVLSGVFAFILFLFSNYVIPDFQRKSKNMLFNIIQARPALNFTPGQFIQSVPGVTIKFDQLHGENQNLMNGVFIHKTATAYEDQRTIIAQKGKIISQTGSNYLKLILYDGYVFEEKIGKINFNERMRQENQTTKFDTLISHLDISEVLNQAIESEKIKDFYQFQTFDELLHTVAEIEKSNTDTNKILANELASQNSHYLNAIEYKPQKEKVKIPFVLDSLDNNTQQNLLTEAQNKINLLQNTKTEKNEEILAKVAHYAKVVMYQQRIIAYSILCVIFFLIGSSIGSIVRKGGMGVPAIISIVIFVTLMLTNVTAENIAWKGNLNPYLAAWLPNLIFAPLGIWLTYNAVRDGAILDVEKYKAFFAPVLRKFIKNKEHQRYQ